MVDEDNNIEGVDTLVLTAVCERTGFFGSSVSVKCMKFTEDNSFLVVTSGNHSIKVYDLRKSLVQLDNYTDDFLKKNPLKAVLAIKESKFLDHIEG